MLYRIFFIFLLCCCFWGSNTVFATTTVQAVTISATTENQKSLMREDMIRTVLASSVWKGFTIQDALVNIDSTLIEPRGRMKGRVISLSSSVIRDGEFLQLFTHEFAHFIDIYILKDTGIGDPSSTFYAISWKGPTIKRAGQRSLDFVSGYSATNQYEDFAESLVFYVFHNRAFLERAMRNESLRQKYIFIQENLFPSGTFMDTNFSIGKVPNYLWDTTKLPISLQKYLYSLTSSI